VLHVAMGALGVMAAIMLMIVFSGAAGIVGSTGDPDAPLALPIIGLTGMALVTFVLTLSLPGILVGIGLLRFAPWARIGGIVLSIFDLMWVPFGTIVGIYGLWVLFSQDAERLFTASPPPAAPPLT